MTQAETDMPKDNALVSAAIIVNLVLTGVMLFALFTRTAPHPPLDVPPFALGPFLGATLALGAAALYLTQRNARFGATLALFFALICLVSYGPHKYFDPMFGRIWPAVVTGQIATATIVFWFVATVLRRRDT